MIDIGLVLKELRMDTARTSKEVGEECGVCRQSIHNIETGKHNPSFKKVQRLLRAFGKKINIVDAA